MDILSEFSQLLRFLKQQVRILSISTRKTKGWFSLAHKDNISITRENTRDISVSISRNITRTNTLICLVLFSLALKHKHKRINININIKEKKNVFVFLVLMLMRK